jgi:hypothetical protein
MVERGKINIAHVNRLGPDWLNGQVGKPPHWKVLFSGYHKGNPIAIWDRGEKEGFWLEERWYFGEDRKGRVRLRPFKFLDINNGSSLEDAVKRTNEELQKLSWEFEDCPLCLSQEKIVEEDCDNDFRRKMISLCYFRVNSRKHYHCGHPDSKKKPLNEFCEPSLYRSPKDERNKA